MQLTPRRTTLTLASLAAAVALGHHAQAAEDGPARHQPPPEAFVACQGKSTTETCSVALGGRAVEGTCAPADDNRLFCQPSAAAAGSPPVPPEAFTACSGKTASDACSVTLPFGAVEGTCSTGSDGRLFCRPSHPPGR